MAEILPPSVPLSSFKSDILVKTQEIKADDDFTVVHRKDGAKDAINDVRRHLKYQPSFVQAIEHLIKELEFMRAAHERDHRDLVAEKAAHTKTKNLLDAERVAHAKDHKDLEVERAAHTKTKKDLEIEKAAHTKAKKDLEVVNDKLQKTQQELKTTNDLLDKTQQELKTTKEQLHQAQEELTKTRDELKKAQETLSKTTAELKTTKEELSKTKDQLHKTQLELEAAIAAAAALGVKLKNAENKLKDSEAQLKDVRTKLESTNKTLTETKTALEESKKKLIETNKTLAETKTALEGSRKQVETLDSENRKLKTQLKEADRKVTDLTADNKFQKESIDYLNEELNKANNSQEEAEKKTIAIERVKDGLISEKVALKNDINELEKKFRGLKHSFMHRENQESGDYYIDQVLWGGKPIKDQTVIEKLLEHANKKTSFTLNNALFKVDTWHGVRKTFVAVYAVKDEAPFRYIYGQEGTTVKFE